MTSHKPHQQTPKPSPQPVQPKQPSDQPAPNQPANPPR